MKSLLNLIRAYFASTARYDVPAGSTWSKQSVEAQRAKQQRELDKAVATAVDFIETKGFKVDSAQH